MKPSAVIKSFTSSGAMLTPLLKVCKTMGYDYPTVYSSTGSHKQIDANDIFMVSSTTRKHFDFLCWDAMTFY